MSQQNVLDDYYELLKRVFSELEVAERDNTQCVSRSELLGDLRAQLRHAKEEAADEELAKEIEVPLLCFIDWLVGTSRLPYADDWIRERPATSLVNNQAGDDEFRDNLIYAIENGQNEALPLYFLALSMGYRGSLDPDEARDRLEQVRNKLKTRQLYAEDPGAFLKKHPVEKRDFTVSPAERVWLVVLIALILLISGGVFTVFKYMDATEELKGVLKKVESTGAPAK